MMMLMVIDEHKEHRKEEKKVLISKNAKVRECAKLMGSKHTKDMWGRKRLMEMEWGRE